MTIRAKFENVVFKPLEDVEIAEGTTVKVYVPEEAPPRQQYKSLRDWPGFGMWADREDIPDGVTYENRLRGHVEDE